MEGVLWSLRRRELPCTTGSLPSFEGPFLPSCSPSQPGIGMRVREGGLQVESVTEKPLSVCLLTRLDQDKVARQ